MSIFSSSEEKGFAPGKCLLKEAVGEKVPAYPCDNGVSAAQHRQPTGWEWREAIDRNCRRSSVVPRYPRNSERVSWIYRVRRLRSWRRTGSSRQSLKFRVIGSRLQGSK